MLFMTFVNYDQYSSYIKYIVSFLKEAYLNVKTSLSSGWRRSTSFYYVIVILGNLNEFVCFR